MRATIGTSDLTLSSLATLPTLGKDADSDGTGVPTKTEVINAFNKIERKLNEIIGQNTFSFDCSGKHIH